MDPMNAGSRIVNFIVNFIRDGTVFALLWNIQHWCTCTVVTREPWNRDNEASDVLGFNSVKCIVLVFPIVIAILILCDTIMKLAYYILRTIFRKTL